MSIDIGKAAFSGFGLIGRRPLSVLMWGIVYAVLVGLPSLWAMSHFLPAYMQMMQGVMSAQVSAHASGASPLEVQRQIQQQMMQEMGPMMQMAPLMWLMGIFGMFVRGVLIAAVLRAVLEPDNKGFFYLRVGMAEVWQALLSFVMSILLVVFMFVSVFVGAIIAAILAVILGKAAVIGVLLVGLGVAVLFIVIALRFALAPAMTYADKTFRLFESWKLTKGHVGALFAIVLILIVLLWVAEIVIGGIAVGVLFANGDQLRAWAQSANTDTADAAAFMQSFWKTMAPFVMGAIVVGSLLSGAMMAIIIAPFATVYKQLTTGAAAPAAF
ncbi:MAG TPA: hypothetical protein VG407_12385 [Caulobacteraceae bacterium]|jgi:hypothetical protein|nr:hypothetical protein [Caulobacteraceae bacterium]